MSPKKIFIFLVIYLIVILLGSVALSYLQKLILDKYSFAVAIVIGILVGLCSGELVRKINTNK